MESDPIGLDGGLNTYAYARSNALRFKDPRGENIHGNWCGPGGGGPTQDGVDQCCKQHDECYDHCKADWKNNVLGTGGEKMQGEIDKCNKDVCGCLANVQPKTNAELRGKIEVQRFFKCIPPPGGPDAPPRSGGRF